MHMHFHYGNGNNEVVFQHFRTDFEPLNGLPCRNIHRHAGTRVHIDQRAVTGLGNLLYATPGKGLKGFHPGNRTFADRHFRARFPEDIYSRCNHLRMGGDTRTRFRHPARVRL
ncbi:MAG: hypothetical protein BWX80_02084 [Candidatus Hydrogenedentes bacterium ADurb.Bin101]|nr:MAG: hypothetical protein BWX80_02084 [Candidatus Hydrogenedentes bacterium ADurb.Bin101]